MSLSTEYQLSDLRRASVRSWLSTFLSLGQRIRDITPAFALGGLSTEPNYDVGVEGQPQPPQADLSSRLPPSVDAGSDSPTTDTPDMLSAAIEVKFLLPVLKPGTHDDKFDDCRPILRAMDDEKDDMESLIRRTHDSVASTISCHANTTLQQPSVTLHDIQSSKGLERDYWDTHWIVKKANSVQPTAAEEARGTNYFWVPVEICSPKQRWNEQDGLVSSLQSISAVLRALTTHHRVTVNYTCDVHVHVGRSDGQLLSLRTLKKLATVLWLSEDVIRSIRDPSSPNFENVFTWGAAMTRNSRLAKLVDSSRKQFHPVPPSSTPFDASCLDALLQQTPAIATIWSSSSHMELGRLLSGPVPQFRRLGFNFSSLGEEDDRATNGPKTIEFRVLEGTLDEDVISAWMTICWALVEIAGEEAPGDGTGALRFTKLVMACLGDIPTESSGPDTVRQRHASGGWDVTGKVDDQKETSMLQGRLRHVVVNGLGVSADMYDTFTESLLRARSIQ